ncbi:hypothetical protein NHQ30_011361 [Ciborinia camelliae]|nr:hypothetical protein NHQ30_011361 [Ciborinia camelliae]
MSNVDAIATSQTQATSAALTPFNPNTHCMILNKPILITQAVKYIEALPPSAQYEASLEVKSYMCNDMTDKAQTMLGFKSWFIERKPWERSQVPKAQMDADFKDLFDFAKSLGPKVTKKFNFNKRLNKALTEKGGLRGQALQKQLREDNYCDGIHFLENAASLFETVSVIEGIGRLNDVILKRWRLGKSKGQNSRYSVTTTDLANVLKTTRPHITRIRDGAKITEDNAERISWNSTELSMAELRSLGCGMVGESGLLRGFSTEGEQFSEFLPAFFDEQLGSSPSKRKRPTLPQTSNKRPRAPLEKSDERKTKLRKHHSTEADTDGEPLDTDVELLQRRIKREVKKPCHCHGIGESWTHDMVKVALRRRRFPLKKLLNLWDTAVAFFERNGEKSLCPRHVNMFARAFNINPSPNIDIDCWATQVFARTHKYLRSQTKCSDKTLLRFQTREENFQDFEHTPRIKQYRQTHYLGALKFFPTQNSHAQPIQNERLFPEGQGWHRTAKHFQYLQDSGLMSSIHQEVQYWKFHQRSFGDEENKVDGAMRNTYFSLIQQLVRQDPAYYRLSVQARSDGSTNLISYPHYSRYFSKEQDIQFIFVECSRGRNAIRDEAVFWFEHTPPTTTTTDDFLEVGNLKPEAPEIKTYIQQIQGATGPTLAFQELNSEDLVQIQSKLGKGVPWVSPDLQHTDVLHSSMMIPISYDCRMAMFSRFSVSAAYVAIIEGGQLVETGETYEAIVQSHRRLIPPDTPRYEEEYGLYHVSHAMPTVVELTGLGALSDALVGRLPWSSPLVQREKAIVLAGGPEFEAYYSKWKEVACQQYAKCFKLMQELDKELFADRSFFSSGDLIDLEEVQPDNDCIIISDDDDDDSGSEGDDESRDDGSSQKSQPSKKGKGKKTKTSTEKGKGKEIEKTTATPEDEIRRGIEDEMRRVIEAEIGRGTEEEIENEVEEVDQLSYR